jgi:hypothetical protein
MGHQQLLFIFLGIFLVGIALVTEYISTNNAQSWAAVNNGLSGTINKSVVISSKNIVPETNDKWEYVSNYNGFSNIDARSLAVRSNNIFAQTYDGSAWLRHIYEISPSKHNGFSAMVKQSSIQFR